MKPAVIKELPPKTNQGTGTGNGSTTATNTETGFEEKIKTIDNRKPQHSLYRNQ